MKSFDKYRENYLVYNNGYLSEDTTIKSKINHHLQLYPISNTGRIWYSKDLNEVYSEFQTSLRTHNKNEAFLDNIDTWHSGPQGIPRITAQINGKDEGNNYYWNNKEIHYTNEYFLTENISYSKYKNSSVLILGGGPTTALSKWEMVQYDYLWSINYFFLNKKIVDHSPSLVSLGNEVNFTPDNVDLYNFLNTNECDIIIQPNDVRRNIENFRLRFDSRIGYFSPRWNGKLGAAHRLLLLAIFLNVKQIYIAGIDGYTRSFNKDLGNEGLHSFQTNVHFKEGYSYDIMVAQNVIFWQYVLDLQKVYNFNIINLGEGHPSNMATEITQIYFNNEKNGNYSI